MTETDGAGLRPDLAKALAAGRRSVAGLEEAAQVVSDALGDEIVVAATDAFRLVGRDSARGVLAITDERFVFAPLVAPAVVAIDRSEVESVSSTSGLMIGEIRVELVDGPTVSFDRILKRFFRPALKAAQALDS